ncbi:uncharacterized protein LOC120417654 [Culex pipiens pallens]|uniref:uncharacterized protein LOC120417654 n=1 Tax=Culex pipiens pallens TaxID=42434 RepID=UPI001952E708|nr:uncharacterized protein LOC120417654 [Culex pipiens pallens]
MTDASVSSKCTGVNIKYEKYQSNRKRSLFTGVLQYDEYRGNAPRSPMNGTSVSHHPCHARRGGHHDEPRTSRFLRASSSGGDRFEESSGHRDHTFIINPPGTIIQKNTIRKNVVDHAVRILAKWAEGIPSSRHKFRDSSNEYGLTTSHSFP